jgi:solute carrier family 6 (neurotransmitter transporter, glycine) member 5/9
MFVHNSFGGLGKCVEVKRKHKIELRGFFLTKLSFSSHLLRFPYTALQYGGGTFLIPYTLIVILVGKPIYYMEILLGQFSSKGCIKVYDFAPAVRGVGFGQCLCTIIVLSIYVSVMALTIRFLIASFSNPLPWSICNVDWNTTTCVDSGVKSVSGVNVTNARSSAELYFM